jgi:hypothetical protein
MLEEEERLESERLVIARQQLGDEIRQVQRFLGEVVAKDAVVRGRVALVEDEVDHSQHARRPLGEPLGLRHAEADAGIGDLGPRPEEPLAHRRLADEECPCDLLRREPRDGPQRERDATRHGERGVTAGEEQSKPVVVVRAVSRRRGRDLPGQRLQRPQLVLLDPSSLEHVERAVA